MKKILLFCLLALFSVVIRAANEKMWCLATVERNGEETYFALDEVPTIEYSDGSLTIRGSKYSIVNLPLSDILKHYIVEATPTGIESISATGDASTEMVDGKAYVTGLKDGAQVYVYTTDGQMVSATTASQDGNACVDLTSLKSGQVYLLRTPSTTYKILNK